MSHSCGRVIGFTLVELLIVVIVLGILAAIAIPRFSGATTSSRENATRATLRTVQEQLELYRMQHDEQYPYLNDLWDVMLKRTNASGELNPQGRWGPYFKYPPVNPFTRASTVVAGGEATWADGWEYDELTGEIFAVGLIGTSEPTDESADDEADEADAPKKGPPPVASIRGHGRGGPRGLPPQAQQ